MFDRETAERLASALRPIDFRTPIADDELTRSYVAHYGLNTERLQYPILHCLGSFGCQNFKLAGQYFAVPLEYQRGTVIVIHGYYDHVGLYSKLIHHCLAAGYSVLAFDLPGHGLSTGEPASIESFDLYSQALADYLMLASQAGVPRPWHVVAQSTGAAAVANYLLQPDAFDRYDFEKIVFLAPLIRPTNWFRRLFKFWLVNPFVKRVRRKFTDNSHDEAFLRFIAEEDPLQAQFLVADWVRSLRFYLAVFKQAEASEYPLHIIQGTGDETVDWRYNLPRLTDRFPNSRAYIIDGARHHLVNESPEYRDKVFSTLDGILQGV
jgi:lysophospholipase